HFSSASLLTFDDVAVQAPPGLAHVLRLGGKLALDDGRDERVGVDLAVGMAQGDADLLAAILENVDIAHVGQPAELAGAVAPDLDEVADVLDALLAQGRIVVGRVADDLGPVLITRVGRETVLED